MTEGKPFTRLRRKPHLLTVAECAAGIRRSLRRRRIATAGSPKDLQQTKALKTWSFTLLFTVATAAACSEGATLVRESPQGGIVTYLYQDDRGGPMFSRHRNDALALIAQKCPSGYAIVQEAEARGISTVQGALEGTEDNSRRRRWGLQFRCKEPSNSPVTKGEP